jgi:hypothetical protein
MICSSGKEKPHTKWLCTARDGAISFSIDKNGEITIKTYK